MNVNGTFLGRGAGSARLVFNSVTQEVEVRNADLDIATSGKGVVHVDGVAAGNILLADGTRYIPAAGAENLPIALQTLADFWQNVLLPAINAVWAFIRDYLVPLFQALIQVWIATMKLELTILAGIWQNVLLPALSAVWSFIKDKVIPIFRELIDFIVETVGPKVEWLTGLVDKLKGVFEAVRDAIGKATDKLKAFADKIKELGDKLPDWMKPGSPTPLEIGLWGINNAIRQLSSVELPRLAASMTGLSMAQVQAPPAMISPMGALAAGAGGPNVTIGPNTLQDPIDLAVLEATIERVVARKFG